MDTKEVIQAIRKWEEEIDEKCCNLLDFIKNKMPFFVKRVKDEPTMFTYPSFCRTILPVVHLLTEYRNNTLKQTILLQGSKEGREYIKNFNTILKFGVEDKKILETTKKLSPLGVDRFIDDLPNKPTEFSSCPQPD